MLPPYRPYVYGSVAAREAFIKTRPDVISRFAKRSSKAFTASRPTKASRSRRSKNTPRARPPPSPNRSMRSMRSVTPSARRRLPRKACKPFSKRSATAARLWPASRRSALSIRGLSRSFMGAASSMHFIALAKASRGEGKNNKRRISRGQCFAQLNSRRRRLVRGCPHRLKNRVGHRLIAGLEKFLHYSTVYFLSVYPPAMRAEFDREFILVVHHPTNQTSNSRQSSILIN